MTEKTLYDYWMICYRRRAVALTLTATSVIVALIVSASLPPVFEARAMFYVPQSATTQRANTGEGVIPLPASNQDDAKADIGVLKARDALRAVQAQFPAKSISAMERDIDFTAGRDGTIQVYVRDRDPALAARIANAYIDHFNTFMAAQARARSQPRIEALTHRLRQLEQRLAEVSRQRLAAAAAAGAGPDAQARELVRSREDIDRELENLRDTATARRTAAARGERIHPIATAAIDDIERQLAEIDGDLARMRVRLLPNHPDYQALVARRAAVQADLDRKLRNLVAGDASHADALSEMSRRRAKQLGAMPGTQLRSSDLDQEYADLRASVLAIRRTLDDLSASALGPGRIGVKIETAMPPEVPVFPIAWLNASIAGVIGLLAGLWYALLLDYIDECARVRRERAG